MEIRPEGLNETQFLPGSSRVDTAVWMHNLDAGKTTGKEARRQLHNKAASNTEQVLAATPHKAPTLRPLASHHEKLSKLDEPDTQDTAGEVVSLLFYWWLLIIDYPNK